MSQTIVTRSRNNIKATCEQCHCTVILAEVNGARVALDSELISVVPVLGKSREPARQIHAETCIRHQREHARRAMAAERKRRR